MWAFQLSHFMRFSQLELKASLRRRKLLLLKSSYIYLENLLKTRVKFLFVVPKMHDHMKLFSHEDPIQDIRPMMLSMAALMLILIPILMLVLNPEKLTSLPLSVAGTNQEIPAAPPGIIESLNITENSNGFSLTALVRTSDVRSSFGDVEQKEWSFEDLTSLQKQLRTLKNLDPKRSRIELSPISTSSIEDVVLWMDLIRKDNEGTLFEEILLISVRDQLR